MGETELFRVWVPQDKGKDPRAPASSVPGACPPHSRLEKDTRVIIPRTQSSSMAAGIAEAILPSFPSSPTLTQVGSQLCGESGAWAFSPGASST